MRAGYLDALASRTLGAAAVLQPATPSRFEPDGPQAGATEVEQLVSSAPRAEPGRIAAAYESLGSPLGDGDDPLGEARAGELAEPVGTLRSRLATPHNEPSLGKGVTDNHPPQPSSRRQAGAHPAAAGEPETDRVAVGSTGLIEATLTRLVPLPEPVDPARLPPMLHEAPEPADPAAYPDRPANNTEATRPRPDPMATHPEAGLGPMVVRIGRIDVRAVHAAPVATPGPVPRRSARPSLADHLRARDRGQR